MRVLLIDANCKNSSTGKIVYDLYTECKNKGHEVAVCYGRGSNIDEENIFKFGIDAETYFHALMTRVTGLTGYYSFFSTRRLLQFIDAFKPDVVHLHELHAYFVNIKPVVNYLKRNNMKTVWTFHCEFMYTGKCGYAFECESWKNKCGNCQQVNEYPSSIFWDFTKIMLMEKKKLFKGFVFLTIVTPSNWLANRVKESFLRGRDIRVLNNGIDTKDIFYPRSFDRLKEKHNITNEKIVLAVAPYLMNPRKGGRTVLDLAKRMKNDSIKFILIGVDYLKEKFDDNVIVMGRTENQEELAEYYSMADVFVICSKMENFPTTCIEALSCGTPICGFDEGGTRETAPRDLGHFVEYGNLDDLEKAVRKFLENEKVNITTQCTQYAKIHYDKSVMVDNYLKLYEEITST